MLYFDKDYNTGCAPEILKALEQYNEKYFACYGTDELCREAKNLMRFDMARDDVDIHFMEGGTQTNYTVISAALRSHEAVISTDYGHIALHETGAVEATGHKVLTVPHQNGKITVAAVKECLSLHGDEHKVKPKMIYISQTTELGSLYSKRELAELYDFAKRRGLFLFIDGARMAAALTSPAADFTIGDIAAFSDAFTVGGTKNGMLIGEAVVLVNPLLKEDFRYHIKQKGALMAKGWLLGLQYCEMFRDGLYYHYGEKANQQAEKIRRCLEKNHVPLFSDAPTNQVFPIFPLEQVMRLSEEVVFEIIEKLGKDKAVVRFVTSYATSDREIFLLCSLIDKICLPKR